MTLSVQRNGIQWPGPTVSMTCLAIVLLFPCVGCGNFSKQSGSETSESDANEHDEHLEHLIPAHKPQTFEALVQQLSIRLPTLQGAGGKDNEAQGEGANEHSRILTEYHEIIDWIPELAADSNLKKKDWETATAIGREIGSIWAKHFGGVTAAQLNTSPGETNRTAAEQIEPLIRRLEELVPESRNPEQRRESPEDQQNSSGDSSVSETDNTL